MNLFANIGRKIMSIFSKYNFANIDVGASVSDDMNTKIDLWNNILKGCAEWQQGDVKPCGIIDTTIGQLATLVSEELDVSANNEQLDVVMKRLNESAKELVQNLVAVGGSVVRPVYTNNKMQFEIAPLGSYIPTSYDLDGTLTGCLILKKFTENKKEYVLIEKHKYENKNHTINVELYEVRNNNLYKKTLQECSQTESLTPVYVWENVEKPFIVEVRNRQPNKIDGSNIPCALWQGTENLIKDADEQYARLLWEQEGGELKVFADEDLFKQRQGDPQKRISNRLNKLFVKLNGNGIDAERITTYAPTLRTQQQIEAFNQILRRCELSWNIGKGTLSDLEAAPQTATQYTGGKKTLYSMIDSIESELEYKYKLIAYIFAYQLSVFAGVTFDDEITITYNDTGRKDPSQMKQEAMLEVQNGIMSKAEYRQKIYGEDEATAAAKVPEENNSNLYGGFSI